MPLDVEHLRHLATAAGLDDVGVAPVGPTPTWEAYRQWVDQGYAGDMRYLTREQALHARADPRHILPETQAVLVAVASYSAAPSPPRPPHHGRVSRYAWGKDDYHRWVLSRLKALVRQISALTATSCPARCYVDTGPVLERAWAQAAGLGWVGNNGCLIHPKLGSYVFIGVALLGIPLPTTRAPKTLPTCGRCTRCMDACPTGAIIQPGVIDARRCLAYLTIEHRGSIPEPFRPALGDRVFGCDVCQDVCPWNQKIRQATAGTSVPLNTTLYLPDLLQITSADFRARFRQTPIWRATPEGLARNAALVLGNLGAPTARASLEEAVEQTKSPLVRGHALWALARLK